MGSGASVLQGGLIGVEVHSPAGYTIDLLPEPWEHPEGLGTEAFLVAIAPVLQASGHAAATRTSVRSANRSVCAAVSSAVRQSHHAALYSHVSRGATPG